MTVTASLFKTRFPEFDDLEESRIEIFIGDAEDELEESAWGDRYDLAVYYLTAHLLALGQETLAGNPMGLSKITSASADGLSTGFGSYTFTSATDAYWSSTSYGREFLRLKRITFTAARVVTWP